MKKIFLPILLSMLLMMPVFADDVTVTGDVSKAISVTFNYNSVAFGSLTQGTNDNQPSPASSTGVYNVTVDSNYAWQVSVNGTDFTDGGSNTFGIGNLTVDTNSTSEDLNPTTAVTTSPAVVGSYSTTGSGLVDYHAYALDIPTYQYATSYSTTLTWTYANQ